METTQAGADNAPASLFAGGGMAGSLQDSRLPSCSREYIHSTVDLGDGMRCSGIGPQADGPALALRESPS